MPEGVLLKCLSETEAYIALSTTQAGACGAHQVGHKMKWLLFRQGLYWPTMLKDCVEFAKGCCNTVGELTWDVLHLITIVADSKSRH